MTTSATQSPVKKTKNPNPMVARAKQLARAAHLHRISILAESVMVTVDGKRMFIRFSASEILEHWVLIGAFTTLALSGLLQRYAGLFSVAWLINTFLGGAETLRTVHNLAGLVFGALMVFHTGRILHTWLVKREAGSMLPRRTDLDDLMGILRYNLGLAPERPQFARFTIEEKLGYWALLLASAVLGLTGVIQWFPALTARLLPGDVLPLAKALHGLTAILTILGTATWHIYHTLLKERNTSIFTGLMSEQDMQANHSLEYQRLMAAYAEVQKLKHSAATAPAAPQET